MMVQIILIILLTVAVPGALTMKNEVDFGYESTKNHGNGYELEMIDLLGLGNRNRMKRHPSLNRNSASKFLLKVYNEISEEEKYEDNAATRYRRALHDDDNLITKLDRQEIEKCNNIITFSSKAATENDVQSIFNHTDISHNDAIINFNTNDVSRDLQLVRSVLRLYQDPSLGKYSQMSAINATISIHQKIYNRKQQTNEFRIVASINTTTAYKGWLELNVTRLMAKWLHHKTLRQVTHGNDMLVSVALATTSWNEIPSSDTGLIMVANARAHKLRDLQPFIIGYFNGPELLAKIQKLRFRRNVVHRQRQNDFHNPSSRFQEAFVPPKSCERLNFTLDFEDLQMHNWVIAPKKFEAFFCGGECNFPLGAKMNATNHAIVQTLMQLKQPNLPKPCCVPTVLGSISILHYINHDSVNLSKYPQSVAKECGCH